MNKLEAMLIEALDTLLPRIELDIAAFHCPIGYAGYIESEIAKLGSALKYVKWDIAAIKDYKVIGYKIKTYPPGERNVSGIVYIFYIIDKVCCDKKGETECQK